MAAMTDFLENKIIDFLFRAQALGVGGATAAAGTGPANTFVALYTVDPTDSTGGTEVTGGSYERVTLPASLANWAGTQGTASTTASTGNTGTTSNNGSLIFPIPTANWGVITGFALMDAVTAGNMLIFGALTNPKTVNNGDAAPTFSAAALSIQIDN